MGIIHKKPNIAYTNKSSIQLIPEIKSIKKIAIINKENISNEIRNPRIKKEISHEELIEKKDKKFEKFDVPEKESMGNISDTNQNSTAFKSCIYTCYDKS